MDDINYKRELRMIQKDAGKQWIKSIDDGYHQSFIEFFSKYCLNYFHTRKSLVKEFNKR
jgi:hypothetical protein